MSRKSQDRVRRFYDQKGWEVDASGVTLDSRLWELQEDYSGDYGKKCDVKVAQHLSSGQFFLDAGSGPVRREDYLDYYKNFVQHFCVDISKQALSLARDALGEQCGYVLASLVDMPFPNDFFDSSISLHVIYHIHKNDQEKAVRELIRVTKPGKPIIIIYRNPFAPFDFLQMIYRTLKLNKVFAGGELYLYVHSLRWWRRFSDSCDIQILPWFVLTARIMRLIIPKNHLGRTLFRWFSILEDKHPSLAVALWSYPLIVLVKKRAAEQQAEKTHHAS